MQSTEQPIQFKAKAKHLADVYGFATFDPFQNFAPCWRSIIRGLGRNMRFITRPMWVERKYSHYPNASRDLEALRVLYQTYKRECEEHYENQ